MIRLAISIRDPQTRSHFQELLPVAAQRVSSRPTMEPIEVTDVGGEEGPLIECLQQYYAKTPGGIAVLICDWLVPSTGADNGTSSLARRCQAIFAKKILGMVAIMAQPRRMRDIDRVISADCTLQFLEEAMELVIDRLEYLRTPANHSSVDSNSIIVRKLRPTNETEFQEYFMLRHRVYTIMGYLDEEVQNSRSGLEINEADLRAIHLGAFYRQGPREILIGTARVVTNQSPDTDLMGLFATLVRNDPVAKQRLDTPYALGLPIFQSHSGMNQIITEVFMGKEICGELSRVIVAPQFRGNGISQKLVNEALDKSIERGAERLFLECLEVHESLYEKYGFQRIAGVVGPVIDVGRTMIAMQMRTNAMQKIRLSLNQMGMAAAG